MTDADVHAVRARVRAGDVDPLDVLSDAQRQRVMSKIRQGKLAYQRSRRARIGSNERAKQEQKATRLVSEAVNIASACGLDPQSIPTWAYGLAYPDRSSGAQ